MEFNSKKGFTLIELLVVISIISFLATLAITSLKNTQVRSRDTKRLGNIDAIKKSMEFFYFDYGEYNGPLCVLPYQISICDMSPYLNTTNIKDPLGSLDVCDGSNIDSCNCAFWRLPNGDRRYMVYYHFEGSTSLGNSGEANCATNNLMTVCGDNVSWLYCIGQSQAMAPPEVWAICAIYDSDGNGNIQNSDRNDYY